MYPGQRLAILAVQEFAHRLPPRLVHFTHTLALVGVHPALSCGGHGFGSAALRATVCETGFIRFELELFPADGADFDGENHLLSMIRRS